eukprot:6199287-Pleurochrysis_carterae.AAC.1
MSGAARSRWRCWPPMVMVLLLVSTAIPTIRACVATLYGDDLMGWQATYPDGDHDYDALLAKGAKDNEASSIIVEGHGCVAIVYGDAGFGGWHATFTEGSYGYDDFIGKGARDNEVSAIRVGFGSPSPSKHCKDAPGWTDQYGHGCELYERDGHCAGGSVRTDWITSPEFRNPELNCCACGGGSTAGGVRSAPCQDTPGWLDPYGHKCDAYAVDGHCRAGVIYHEWIATLAFNNPHYNCCICGKT